MRTWKIWLLIAILGITLFGIYQLLVYSYFLFPWAVPWVGDIIIASPPKPKITYGEFPISVTYEVDGETKVVEDTVICEFDGIEMRGGAGKYRKWKSRLKSGNESLTLLLVEQEGLTVKIITFYGLPNYYMGDFEQSKEAYERVMADDRYLHYIQWENGVQTGRSIPKEEVWEKYRLKVVSWEYSPPITNSFK